MIRTAVRALVAPLRDRSNFPRLVFLLLGSALALAFAMLDITVLVSIPLDRLWLPLAALVPLAVIGLPPVAVSLIPAVRVVEGSAVRSLVYPALPEHLRPARDWDTRWRAALWFLLHLGTGAVLLFAVPFGVGWMVQLVLAPSRGLAELTPFPVHLPGGWATAWAPVAALLIPVLVGYLTAALGALLTRAAMPLLGPSAPERLAALESRAGQLVERARLARELHDSIGHALTVTTLQAAAAGRVLDNDREFARQALAAIEETGRAALADLDHVLGLLRDESAPTAPQRTLADLDGLLEATRAAGVDVRAELTGARDAVPAVVSREAYRIVREGMTNALRHAGQVPVTLRLAVHPDRLEIELTNPVRRSGKIHSGRAGGGTGLSGIRERVSLLRGTMSAGTTDGRWRVHVVLPAGTPDRTEARP